MSVFHTLATLSLLSLTLVREIQSACTLANLPLTDSGICAADLQCVSVINDLDAIVKDWSCIQIKNERNYDYYYDYRRNRPRITYNSAYDLHMHALQINEEDQFNRLNAINTHMKTITVRNGNLVSIPAPLYTLEHVIDIEVTSNKIEKFYLKNFFNNMNLNKINVSYNFISLLGTDNELGGREDSTSITNLDLSHNLIEELPNNFFSHVSRLEHLNMSYNNIRKFDILTFEGITQLQSLILSYNKIVEIGNTFVRFVNLKTLFLDNNRIANIIGPNFVSMVKLESLNLTNNLIENIEDAAFQSLANVKNIDLSHNRIETITTSLFRNNSKIEFLSLSDNNITLIESGSFEGKDITNFFIENNHLSGSIEKGTFSGINVRVLNFTGAYIETLGDEAFSMMGRNIISLNLTFNRINNISEFAFKSLNLLTELDLSNNYLTELKFDTADLNNLSLLYAQNNKIKKIQKSFFSHLLTLTVLDLSQNLISEIETSSFESLNNLEKLILNDNNLVYIFDSYTFTGLTSLREITLMNSRVQNYKDNAFSGMSNLKSVNSSYGQLTYVQYNTFQNTGDIEVLDFSYNLLENFTINTTAVRNLKQLYLNNNRIRKIANDTFFQLPSLLKLDLSQNNIIEICSDAFSSLTSLLYLELSSNPEMEISSTIFDNITALSKVTMGNMRKPFTFKDAINSSVVNLQLPNCNITNINDVYIYNIRNVAVLNLTSNKISFIDKFSFQNMYSLISLDLSFNMIKGIQPGSFLRTGSINSLNLHSNYIESMQFGVLSGLEYLQTFNLSSNLLHGFEANLLHKTPRLSVLSLDNNLIKTISFSDFLNTAINIISIGGNPIPCSEFVKLGNMKDLKFNVTTENLDYHSENVNGVTCKTDNREIIEANTNNQNLTLTFANIADAIKELRQSIEAFSNKTITTEGDAKNNFVNMTADEDHLISYYNRSHTEYLRELQHTVEIFANRTATSENNINNIIAKMSTALDRLPSYFNRTQIELDKHMKILTDVTNNTKFNSKYMAEKSDVSSLHPIIKNYTVFDKEADLTRSELRNVLHNWQNSLNSNPQKIKSVEDIKVLLYFISVCMAIILVLIVCYSLYMLMRRKTILRSSVLYNSSQPITNTMEMQ